MSQNRKQQQNPDQIIREIPLISRYARHNEAQDFSFRAYLKGELDMSNKKLDAVVKETTDEVWAQIDCTTCANCCKTLQIIIDDADISRLAQRFSMTPGQFKSKYVGTDADKSMHFNSQPCPFLGNDNRCTVYESRPTACHDYPYLYKSEFRSRSFIMIDSTATCPIVFNVWQRLKKRLGFRGRR